jgi:hypothetical protein
MHHRRPFLLANFGIARDLLIGHERIDQGVCLPESARQIAAPTIVVGTGNDVRAHRVGFNVPQDRQQVFVVLDNRTFEAALPDVAARTVMLVVALRVRDQKALHDAADRILKRLNQKVKMVVQQAIAVKFKGLPLFKVGKRLKKRHKVGVFMEDILSIISAIDDVISQAIVDGS